MFAAPLPMSMPSPVFPEITLRARVVAPPMVVPVPPAMIDAGGQVAHRGRALDVGADQVARHDGPRRGRAGDQDAFRVPRDEVTPAGRPARRWYWTTEPSSISTPAPVLPRASVPVWSRPIRLPWTRVPLESLISTPLALLPEIRLPAPADVPPIVTDELHCDIHAVAGVAQSGGAGGVGADPVAGDHVGVGVDVVHSIAGVGGDHVAPTRLPVRRSRRYRGRRRCCRRSRCPSR